MKKLLFATIIIATSSQAMEPVTQEAEDLTAKQHELNRDLLAATAKGQKEQVLNLLAQGAQPDPTEPIGYCGHGIHALGLAAWVKQEEICKILIDHKADVNYADIDKKTPLMYAAQRSDFDNDYDPATSTAICKLLIDHGALVNAYCLTGKTPLIYAHYAKDQMACDLLKSHGAIDDLESIFCQAALHAPKEYSDRQQNLLYEAFRESPTNSFEPYNFVLLLAVNAHRCRDGLSGIAALTHAVMNNRIACCEDLLKYGVDPDRSILNHNQTPLMYAAQSGYLKLVQLLIQYGAKVSARNRYNETALMEGVKAWKNGQSISEIIVEALLCVPNKKQNKKIIAFLGSAKKARPEIFNADIRNILKVPFQDVLSAQNKTNFKESVAYEHIAELRECGTKTYLLEKYQNN